MNTCSICKQRMLETVGIFYVRDPSTSKMQEILLCQTCAEEAAGYMLFLIERGKEDREIKTFTERLDKLGAGTIVTIFEETPSAIPSESMRKSLNGTPYSKIWDM